jgi:hypothetical protein
MRLSPLKAGHGPRVKEGIMQPKHHLQRSLFEEAEIAAKLVSEDPALMLPANRDKLEAEMREIYKREERAWLAEAGLF